jgi:hypothetical protein
MRSPRFAVFLIVLLAPLSAIGIAHLATKISSGGLYMPAKSSIDIPDGAVGLWNKSNRLTARNTLGVDYIMASPFPTVGGSFDAGTTVGSGAATKVDTCSTGNTGASCFTLKDVVNILKTNGTLAQ